MFGNVKKMFNRIFVLEHKHTHSVSSKAPGQTSWVSHKMNPTGSIKALYFTTNSAGRCTKWVILFWLHHNLNIVGPVSQLGKPNVGAAETHDAVQESRQQHHLESCKESRVIDLVSSPGMVMVFGCTTQNYLGPWGYKAGSEMRTLRSTW